MPKISDKDWQFLFNAVVLSLVIMGMLHAFMPYISTPEARLEEVRATDRRIVTVKAADVPALLRNASGKPVMLVVYASWCPYCRKLMPTVTGLLRDHRLDRVSPVFLSMDYEPRELSKYLVRQDYHTLFIPYMLEQNIVNHRLSDALKTTGSGFNGAIPYIGFFDGQGKMVGELFGVVDGEKVLKAADQQ